MKAAGSLPTLAPKCGARYPLLAAAAIWLPLFQCGGATLNSALPVSSTAALQCCICCSTCLRNTFFHIMQLCPERIAQSGVATTAELVDMLALPLRLGGMGLRPVQRIAASAASSKVSFDESPTLGRSVDELWSDAAAFISSASAKNSAFLQADI